MLGDNEIKQNTVAMVMVKPGAGAGGQRVGAVRCGAEPELIVDRKLESDPRRRDENIR